MIITRYLVKETLKTQIAILFVLFLIFFSQKLVRILSAAVDGDVPTSIIFSLLMLGIPEMAQLILPLSLFLAIAICFGRLYSNSEITVMQACGFSQTILLKSAMLLAFLTLLLALYNSFWIGPWSVSHQQKITADAKMNPGAAALIDGQFQTSSDGSTVLFVSNVKGNTFERVFLAQIKPSENLRPSVIIARNGYIQSQSDGSQKVFLQEGRRYEGTEALLDFRITHFLDYQAIIGHRDLSSVTPDIEQLSLAELRSRGDLPAIAEINWRLTLAFSPIIMALLIVPLSVVNPRQGRFMSLLPALFLYLIYFLLQSTLHSNGDRGRLDSTIWVWSVNIGYLALAIFLICWDTIPMRRLRNWFKRGVSV